MNFARLAAIAMGGLIVSAVIGATGANSQTSTQPIAQSGPQQRSSDSVAERAAVQETSKRSETRRARAVRERLAREEAARRRGIDRRAIGGGTRVPLQPGPDRRSSEAGVCRSQCNLERSTCDSRGPSSFRNRADEISAARSSCFLAVQSCLARCR